MLNQRELDVLNILWENHETPMTSSDIMYKMRGLTQSTVISVLRKLLKDNLVEVCGVTHSGKVLSRTYRPTEESKTELLNSFLELYGSFVAVIDPELMASKILEMKK